MLPSTTSYRSKSQFRPAATRITLEEIIKKGKLLKSNKPVLVPIHPQKELSFVKTEKSGLSSSFISAAETSDSSWNDSHTKERNVRNASSTTVDVIKSVKKSSTRRIIIISDAKQISHQESAPILGGSHGSELVAQETIQIQKEPIEQKVKKLTLQDVVIECIQIENKHLGELTKETMKYHFISEQNRARMLDWMIQVFRVFNVGSPSIYFACATLLDRYYECKMQKQQRLTVDDLYLTAIACVHIVSKVEGVEEIDLKALIVKAGHSKFSKKQILASEQDILRAVGFIVHTTHSVYSEAVLLMNQVGDEAVISKSKRFLEFLCYLSSLNVSLSSMPIEAVAQAAVQMAMKHCGGSYKQEMKKSGWYLNARTELSQFYVKSLRYLDGSMRNLEKSYPEFLGSQTQVIPSDLRTSISASQQQNYQESKHASVL